MTRMILRVLLVVLALGVPGRADLGAQVPDRRARLEAQVRSRFLELATNRLQLTVEQRQRLAGVLDEGVDARRQLLRESVRLRQRLIAAAQDPTTPSSTFEEILRQKEALSERERAIERREQERLSAFLEPRQRALFLLMRMRFNEQVREVRGRGPRG